MTPTNPTNTVTVAQAPGWWAALVRAECAACAWTGPVRDLNAPSHYLGWGDWHARRDADDHARRCEAVA